MVNLYTWKEIWGCMNVLRSGNFIFGIKYTIKRAMIYASIKFVILFNGYISQGNSIFSLWSKLSIHFYKLHNKWSKYCILSIKRAHGKASWFRLTKKHFSYTTKPLFFMLSMLVFFMQNVQLGEVNIFIFH